MGSLERKPDNPFHEKIEQIVRRVMKEEIEAAAEDLIVKKLAPTIEELLEKTAPAIVAAELHNLLDGAQRKLAPGGRIKGGEKKKPRGNNGTTQPRKRCPKCKGCMRQQPPNSGEYECRKCDAGGETS